MQVSVVCALLIIMSVWWKLSGFQLKEEHLRPVHTLESDVRLSGVLGSILFAEDGRVRGHGLPNVCELPKGTTLQYVYNTGQKGRTHSWQNRSYVVGYIVNKPDDSALSSKDDNGAVCACACSKKQFIITAGEKSWESFLKGQKLADLNIARAEKLLIK
ncbi:hypothetical protein AB4254_07945 [Vibrio breoganii]